MKPTLTLIKMLLSLAALALAGLLGGCAHEETGPVLPPPGMYVLFELNGRPIDVPTPVQARLTTQQLGGSGPVNRWNAMIVDGKLGPVAATRMAGPPELMQREQMLTSALEGAQLREGPAGQLLCLKDGRVTAVFLPKSQ